MIIQRSALIQFQKHVAPKIITPEQNQTADGYKFGYRNVGIADVYENKLVGIYLHNKNYPFIVKRVIIENTILQVQGVSPHEFLERRITIPPSGKYAVTNAGTPDKVVKDLIRACTSASNRVLPIFCLPDRLTGISVSETSRLKTLGDEISRICAACGVGEVFVMDAENGRITFDTCYGIDRSVGNADDTPPCVFAKKYNNLTDYSYDINTDSIVTTAIVAGAGEGVDRELIAVGDNAVGINRYETLVDARDVERGNTTLLRERGEAKLTGVAETIKLNENQTGNLIFGADYDLGDIVTVLLTVPEYQHVGGFFDMTSSRLVVNQRVSEVTVTIAGGEQNIDVTFGEIPKSQTFALHGDVEQLKTR